MKNPDNFGYYQVGDLKFYSKLEAVELHAKTNIHPHWNFNDAAYHSMDWTKEPIETLRELYQQRAQQLRDEYDYIVLWYSGGADSDNILHSFVDNDIKLDEVASYMNYALDPSKESMTNGEIFFVAAPKIENLKNKYPDIVHRIIDLGHATVKGFDTNNQFDWIYHANTIVTPGTIAKQDLVRSVPEWQKMFDQGKKVAFVYGVDKPRVTQSSTGEYVFKFIDILDPCVTPKNQIDNFPWYHPEFFYWTPDFPKIPIKQAHIIKNYLKASSITTQWMTTTNQQLCYKIINGNKIYLTTDGIHSLIYPTWVPVPYQYKPPSPIFGYRDAAFRKLTSEVSWKIWHNGLKKRWNIVPDYWKNDPNDMSKGFKCSTTEYNLGN